MIRLRIFFLLFLANFALSSLSAQAPKEIQSIIGFVESETKERSDDGYTLQIKAEGKTYEALISIPNLEDTDEHQKFKKGDKVLIKGEYWQLQGRNRISVHSIKAVRKIKIVPSDTQIYDYGVRGK